MSPGIGLLDLAGGALVILGIFGAFMVWAIFPLLPFLLIGAVYAGVRHGVPAAGRAALAVEEAVVRGIRWGLHPLALWALREARATSAEQGRRRR
ncbi:MAG: hypothetical protein AMS25_06915 [Gemmatimonas sp. SM23_52]|nr:MAG: hypothetical protein AMS25_06915 [Gemmatimonas sp. SM23_52]